MFLHKNTYRRRSGVSVKEFRESLRDFLRIRLFRSGTGKKQKNMNDNQNNVNSFLDSMDGAPADELTAAENGFVSPAGNTRQAPFAPAAVWPGEQQIITTRQTGGLHKG